MSSTIQVTALSGENSTDSVCFLLEIDDARLLLDCGGEPLRPESVEGLRRILATDSIDAVLISHADPRHLNLLPYAVGNLGLDCPVYLSLPIWRLGKLALYESVAEWKERLVSCPYSLEDVDAAFDLCVPLKYAQEFSLGGRAQGITVTPFCAGNSLGGSLWRISKENEEIVYAMKFSHRREQHLNGAVLETVCVKPSVLISDAYGATAKYVPRKLRDDQFFEVVLSTLGSGGNVLLPVELCGRTLELLLMLNLVWEKQKLKSKYSLVLLSHFGYHGLEYAKSFIEWMSDRLQKEFNQNRENPFNLRSVQLCYNLKELEIVLENGPGKAVVLATSSSMNNSLAEEVFLNWADDEKNTILFTESSYPVGSLASRLLDLSNKEEREISITKNFKVPLTGTELTLYLEQKKLEAESLTKVVEDEDDVEESEDEEEKLSIFKRKERLQPSFPMFVAKDNHPIWDEYGEPFKPEEFFLIDLNLEANASEQRDNELQKSKEREELKHDDEEEEEIPSKEMREVVKLKVNCKVKLAAFEGIVDGGSLRKILAHVAPRKLVLVRGSVDAKNELKQSCENSGCKNVQIAKNNQTLTITADLGTFKVRLKDTLEKTLKFHRIRDSYEVAYLDARLESQSEFGLPALKRLKVEETEGHTAIFLGDVKMKDHIQKSLNQGGLEAEFVGKGGVLVCGEEGAINLRKTTDTLISLRGAISMEYYRMRDLVYSNFQIL